MGLSHKWVCGMVLLIVVVCHMSVITHGDETIEAEKWSCDECRLNWRKCLPHNHCRRPRGSRGGGGTLVIMSKLVVLTAPGDNGSESNP
ncbi:hypothetical protein Hdeb2414_s0088g00786641 [Helianthus debilis subsp. tardiflorus]